MERETEMKRNNIEWFFKGTVIGLFVMMLVLSYRINTLENTIKDLYVKTETETNAEVNETTEINKETESEKDYSYLDEIDENMMFEHDDYIYFACTVTELDWHTYTVIVPNGNLETFHMVQDPPIDDYGNPCFYLVWYKVHKDYYQNMKVWEVVGLE